MPIENLYSFKSVVKFRFYDKKENKLLYLENTSTGNDIFYNVDGERKTIGFLFSFPERFEPNQLVYIDGNVSSI